jgi:hypothetical protein
MPPVVIRTQNLSRRAVADPRLRPRGHWDRLTKYSKGDEMKQEMGAKHTAYDKEEMHTNI